MSSIILQAADKRIMMPNHTLCHYGAFKLRQLSRHRTGLLEEKILETPLEIYVEKAAKGKYFKEKFNPVTQKRKIF